MRKKLLFFLKLVFGLSLLVYLVFFKANPKEIVEVLKRAYFPYIIFAFSLHSIGILISAARWKLLLKNQSSKYSILDLSKSYLVSCFFNHFLPTRFGGDIVRISDTKKIEKGVSASTAIVVIERMSGIIVLLFFASISSVIKINFVQESLIILVALFAGVIGIALFLILWKVLPLGFFNKFKFRRNSLNKLFIKLNEFLFVIKNSLKQKRLMKRVFLLSFLLQLNVIIHYYFIGISIGVNIPFFDYFFTIPILLLALSIPISINGIGIRELVLIKFFVFYSFSPEYAISFSFLDMIFNLILGIVGGIIYISRKK
jgi:uncharacterized protein (TIRG00374 family)